MNKSIFFSGQPIFSQLIKMIPRELVSYQAISLGSDRYYKKFDTYHHLISMLYCCYQHCTSLREIVTGLRACEGRLHSLGVRYLPTRSTFSEANMNRGYEVFAQIYQSLYERYHKSLPDSHNPRQAKRLVIIDSTTISLFKEILKNAGRSKNDGRRKGGVKVHVAMHSHEDVPFKIKLTAAAKSDVPFLQEVDIAQDTVVTFDKGYVNFNKYNTWTKDRVSWVTRIKENAVFNILDQNQVEQNQTEKGIISDHKIILGTDNGKIERVECRLIQYVDKVKDRTFRFITNNMELSALQVAQIYQSRWQIELLFKRLKQNMPLQYFIGDNENAIKIQIYCALIADLLLKLTLGMVNRKWAFSTLASLVRLHLMNYTNLKRFLNSPDKYPIHNPPPEQKQLRLHF